MSKGLDKKTFSPQQIAKKHNVNLAHIHKQLKMGIDVEKEHTSDPVIAREIALDHLGEHPDYYTRLKKVEKLKEAVKSVFVKPNTIYMYNNSGKQIGAKSFRNEKDRQRFQKAYNKGKTIISDRERQQFDKMWKLSSDILKRWKEKK